MTTCINKSHKKNNSSDISDIEENATISDAFNFDERAKTKKECNEDSEEYMKKVVLDRVIKYIKLDDVIKEKQNEHKKEMKKIKEIKVQLEQFLIDYLDKVNEEHIQLGNKTTLIKTEIQTKSHPKMEDINLCLIDGFKKHEIYKSDEEIQRVVADFIKTIEEKRETKTRKYIKRKDNNEKKKKEPKK